MPRQAHLKVIVERPNRGRRTVDLTLSLTTEEAQMLATKNMVDNERALDLLNEVIAALRMQAVCALALAEHPMFALGSEDVKQ